MKHSIRLFVFAVLLFVCATRANAQQVLTVDETGASGTFLDIQAAVDVAADGDLILVKTGSYGGFVVNAKALSIMADSGAVVVVTSFAGVFNTVAGQHVVFSDLIFRGLAFSALVTLDNCVGPILIQDCQVEYLGSNSSGTTVGAGLSIRDCAAVSVVETTIDSMVGESPLEIEKGVTCLDSNAYFYGCTIRAGTGVSANAQTTIFGMPPTPGSNGPEAVRLDGGFMLFADSQLYGGRGGLADATPSGLECQTAGDGGAALLMVGSVSAPTVQVFDSTFVVGAGGRGAGACPAGLPAPNAIKISAGTVQLDPRQPRKLESSSVLREGEQLILNFIGQPFDLTWLVFSVDPATIVYSDALAGTIYNGSPFSALFMGALNAQGTKTKSFTISDIGLDYLPALLQAYYFDSSSQFEISNPRTATILDGATP